MANHPLLVAARKKYAEEKLAEEKLAEEELAEARNNELNGNSDDSTVFDTTSSKRKREVTPQSQGDAQLNVKKVRKSNNQESATPTSSDDDCESELDPRPHHDRSGDSGTIGRQGTRRFPLETEPDYSITSLIPLHATTALAESITNPTRSAPKTVSVRFNMHSLNKQAKRLGISSTADVVGEIGADGKLRMKKYYNKNGTIAEVSIPKFDCLPDTILTKIFRLLFVRDDLVKLDGSVELNRSAALLRVCKRFHEVGTTILYGENGFVLARRHGLRGTYWENPWKEIGFKDVHQFIVEIGPRNIKKIKYLKLHLEDAAPSLTPKMSDAERRFVNDTLLHDALKTIGSSALLEKLVVIFSNRKGIDGHDEAFSKSLSSIKCHELEIVITSSRRNRLAPGLEEVLRFLMVAPRANDVDVSKRVVPKLT